MIKNLKELRDVLEQLILGSDKVFITPHIGPDCDAIASAIGLGMIVRKLGCEAYIVINDDNAKLEAATKVLLAEVPNCIGVVNIQQVEELCKEGNNSFIATDTNKVNLVPFDDFSVFNNKLLIDHHEAGEQTIKEAQAFIDTSYSSASEIVFHLLAMFKVNIDSNIANCLLSGICLDTAKFTKHVSQGTMEVVAKLMKKGADMNYINELFLDDFESDMRITNLVSKTAWQLFNIAMTYNVDDPFMIYTKEDLAKAADWLLRYKGTDASFSLGFIDEGQVYISARSRGVIDVGSIMAEMQGGGNEYSAAAKVESNDIAQVKLTLEKVIRPGYRLK